LLKNRYFHSSKVNLADEELVKRVAALKSDYREEDILLNNTEIQNLKEIIKNIKNFDTNSSIDKEKWLQDVKQNISSLKRLCLNILELSKPNRVWLPPSKLERKMKIVLME